MELLPAAQSILVNPLRKRNTDAITAIDVRPGLVKVYARGAAAHTWAEENLPRFGRVELQRGVYLVHVGRNNDGLMNAIQFLDPDIMQQAEASV